MKEVLVFSFQTKIRVIWRVVRSQISRRTHNIQRWEHTRREEVRWINTLLGNFTYYITLLQNLDPRRYVVTPVKHNSLLRFHVVLLLFTGVTLYVNIPQRRQSVMVWKLITGSPPAQSKDQHCVTFWPPPPGSYALGPLEVPLHQFMTPPKRFDTYVPLQLLICRRMCNFFVLLYLSILYSSGGPKHSHAQHPG